VQPVPVHPYTRSWRKNWLYFLNVTGKRGWWSILLPSPHHPAGDGWDWSHLTQSKDSINVV
jgi:hypothetical protein